MSAKTFLRYVTCLLILATSLCFKLRAAQAQDAEVFRSLLSQFAINLPVKGSEFNSLVAVVADYPFPVRQYRWKAKDETITILAGSGQNDLEVPEYTKLFLDDFKAQQELKRTKSGWTNIASEPTTFDGHPGWRFVEQSNGSLIDSKVLLVRYWFFVITLTTNSSQTELTDRQKQTLASFRILSTSELAEAVEEIVDSIDPGAMSQGPVTGQTLSDAREDNLRDNVKQVLIEESKNFGPRRPGDRFPTTRTDYDPQGYMIKRVDYVSRLPVTVTRYGYENGSRVFDEVSSNHCRRRPAASTKPTPTLRCAS